MLSNEEMVDLLYDEMENWELEEGLDPNFLDNHDYYTGAKVALRRLIRLFEST